MKILGPSDGEMAVLPVQKPAPIIVGVPRASAAPVAIHRPRPLVQALPPARSMVVQGLGSQGPAGLSAFQDWQLRNPGGTWEEFLASLGTGSVAAMILFAFGDASPRVVMTLPEDAFIDELKVVVEQAFDGADPQISVRTNGAVILIGADQVDPTFAATYESTPQAQLPAGTEIILELDPGFGATAGRGRLLFNLH